MTPEGRRGKSEQALKLYDLRVKFPRLLRISNLRAGNPGVSDAVLLSLAHERKSKFHEVASERLKGRGEQVTEYAIFRELRVMEIKLSSEEIAAIINS